MSTERKYVERTKQLKKMAWVLVALGAGFDLMAYLFFSKSQQEHFYMTSLVFFAMAIFCHFSKPRI